MSAPIYTIDLVSVSSSGEQADGNSGDYWYASSYDGRYIAFESSAHNLVEDDTNPYKDIFVRDRVTDTTVRVSVSSDGTVGFGDSMYPSVSSDGRFIAFESEAKLTSNDTNNAADVYLHDMQTGETKLIGLTIDGLQPITGAGGLPVISADGNHVAFVSASRDMFPGDPGQDSDVFVRDLQTNETALVSVSLTGMPGNGYSYNPSISADGRYIAFVSIAGDLIPNHHYGWTDVYVRDMQTGITSRVTVPYTGDYTNLGSDSTSISADGRYVVFQSTSTNLLPNDSGNRGAVYLRDTLLGVTTKVSVASDGTWHGGEYPSISADGRFIVFDSNDPMIVPNDTSVTFDVFIHDMQTGETTLLSASNDLALGNAGSFEPKISPDGHSVMFHSYATNLVYGDANGRQDVFVSSTPPYPHSDAAPVRNYTTDAFTTLTWTPVQQATGYEIQLATDSSFDPSVIALDAPLPVNKNYVKIIQFDNGVYYWRIRARFSSTVFGPWSPVDSFIIAAP